MSREMALQAYRHLLRSTRIAFEGMRQPLPLSIDATQKTYIRAGDMSTLFAARTKVRSQFEENRRLPSGSKEMSEQITHAEEVAKFLKENVVQGHATDADGNYSMMEGFCKSLDSLFANDT